MKLIIYVIYFVVIGIPIHDAQTQGRYVWDPVMGWTYVGPPQGPYIGRRGYYPESWQHQWQYRYVPDHYRRQEEHGYPPGNWIDCRREPWRCR